MKPAENTRYSYTWAWGIVKKLAETYPRATEIAAQVWNLSHRQLAYFLANGHPFWAFFRDEVHFIYEHTVAARFEPNLLYMRKVIRERLNRSSSDLATPKLLAYLDKLIEDATLKEQVSREGAEEVVPHDRSPQPSCPTPWGVQYVFEFDFNPAPAEGIPGCQAGNQRDGAAPGGAGTEDDLWQHEPANEKDS